MIKGLTEEQEKIVKDILNEFQNSQPNSQPNYQFYYYGSRVKGNFVKSSDLDILIKGEQPASMMIIDELKEKFYQSKLPFIVNIVDFNNLDDIFYEQIKSDLVLC